MRFKQSHQFYLDLEDALTYYLTLDLDLVSRFLDELGDMEAHLTDFPGASPFTSIPPIRKYILKTFPYRVRYSYKKNQVIFLTLENMSKNKPL